MKTLASSRLKLRELTFNDADFIVKLLNDPGWLEYIGDHGVKNKQDAGVYIQQGPQSMYQKYGFGLLLVESTTDNTSIGLCGLLQRPTLPFPDLGFAFLPQYRKKGFALEASQLVLADAKERKITDKVLAITSVDNQKSIALLFKLGFRFKELVDLHQNGDQTKLFELVILL